MKTIRKQSDNKAAFTIVELLTVMSIIVILISLLVPALTMVRKYAWQVKQKAQFHAIEVALDIYAAEQEGYPDSDALDEEDEPYCGAMKLCEAMVGQDLLGLHPDSHFRSDLKTKSAATDPLYEDKVNYASFEADAENLGSRKGPYLQLENANAHRLKNLYGEGETITPSPDSVTLGEERFVLCDVYRNVIDKQTGKSVGMPILYYKADISKVRHDVSEPDKSIYNYEDNDHLVLLGMPFDGGGGDPAHYMATKKGSITTRHEKSSGGYEDPDPVKFYDNTKNENINITGGRPYRANSYILLSAGFDGEYGTGDDIFNFEN